LYPAASGWTAGDGFQAVMGVLLPTGTSTSSGFLRAILSMLYRKTCTKLKKYLLDRGQHAHMNKLS
jgi:hypothetical protein